MRKHSKEAFAKASRIIIGARDSKLSRAQVEEVLTAKGSGFENLNADRKLRHHETGSGFENLNADRKLRRHKSPKPDPFTSAPFAFETRFFQTKGDKDLITSLRTLPPGNFFTQELDEALLEGVIDVAIHSAKDLPPLLLEGLELIALTQGLTAQDALVLRKDVSIKDLPPGARIATSSERREEAVCKLCPTATFIDIRGTVDSRLEKLVQGQIDGLVVAACALERLRITEFPIYLLDAPTARYQGRLAVVARKNDARVKTFFSSIDTKKTLFFGLESKKGAIHLPLIQTIANPIDTHFSSIERADLIIFTSKAAVDHFVEAFAKLAFVEKFDDCGAASIFEKSDILEGVGDFSKIEAVSESANFSRNRSFARASVEQVPTTLLKAVRKKRIVAIGEKTASRLELNGFCHIETPKEETSEGVVNYLKSLSLENVFIFYPHSARSRDVIRNFLEETKVAFADVILYDTRFIAPNTDIDPNTFDELYFSSPSTFDAFLHFFHKIPENIFIKTEGSVTRNYIENYLGDPYDVHVTSVTI